jgi:pseudomonalisin
MLRRFAAALAAALFFSPLFLLAQTIDESRIITLAGNRPPLARAEFDAGPVAPDYSLQHMILVLRPDPRRQAELASLLAAQQDPGSPQFHQWLTPSDFENQFGASREDVDRVTQWLASHGFSIDEIPAGRQSIIFSGTAAEVESAFHTSIRTYNVAGRIHHANSADPQIPEALASILAGAVSLHDFRRAPMHHGVTPQFTSGSAHYLAPGDFATIYDVAPLYSSSITGAGQSIAIVGRVNIRVSDVQAFRTLFGLPSNNPTVIVNGSDPGIWSTDEEAEADLDVEWSGAVAPQATIKFVVSASTSMTDGVDLSAQYIVSNNVAPVLSASFGSCESAMGTAERAFYNNLWQQAAAQGITAMVSAGDSGAAGCDSPSASTAVYGLAVNGLCSTPYSVCVGGTEFNEASSNNYWSQE